MYYNADHIMATPDQNHPTITYRHCESDSDYAACVALQEATWGTEDVVPVTLLKAAQKIGGIAAGAFEPSGRMIGSVFGMSGLHEGRPTHWSHMLAVVPEARGRGVGHGLKMIQRDALLDIGIDQIRWTYDPLESINAHFNINGLGALPVEYVRDMYGDGESNLLHQGLGTDRFVVEWTPKSIARPISSNKVEGASISRVEIPTNIQELKKSNPEEAIAWRTSTREAFQKYLADGFGITGFCRSDEGRCYYILELKT